MGILVALAPFIVFALVDRLIGSTEGLIAGAFASAAPLLRDLMSLGRKPKILEIGTLLLFGGLTLYAILGAVTLSIIGVRLSVDAGLLLIVLISMAVGSPFTIQYAREKVAPEFWSAPEFVRTNYVITAAWALAFAIMVIAELTLLYMPALSPRIGIIAVILAVIGTVKFTAWYPERVRAKVVV